MNPSARSTARAATALRVAGGLAVLLLALAGCGGGPSEDPTTDPVSSDPASSDPVSSDPASSDPADDDYQPGGFVTGTPQEWLTAACGDVEPVEDTAPRLKDATQAWSCGVQFRQGEDGYSYVEASLFDIDVTDRWAPAEDEGEFLTYAIGQVSENQWAVVWEDGSYDLLTDPHLAPLVDFGFTVVVNNEPVQ